VASETQSGFIKWYNSEREYGFIVPTNGGGDVLFRRVDCVNAGIDPATLDNGQACTYTLRRGNKDRWRVDTLLTVTHNTQHAVESAQKED
jgi:cold shock CspA family protein